MSEIAIASETYTGTIESVGESYTGKIKDNAAGD